VNTEDKLVATSVKGLICPAKMKRDGQRNRESDILRFNSRSTFASVAVQCTHPDGNIFAHSKSLSSLNLFLSLSSSFLKFEYAFWGTKGTCIQGNIARRVAASTSALSYAPGIFHTSMPLFPSCEDNLNVYFLKVLVLDFTQGIHHVLRMHQKSGDLFQDKQ